MQKVKANALWKGLSPEQQKTLDKWLFEEKLAYTEILPRAQSELGFKGELSSLKRYFARRRKERTLQEFKELRDEMADISGAPGDVAALRTASLKLLGRFLFKQAQQSPDKVKDWAPVASLLVQNEHNEVLREMKAEEHRIRREAMAMAKERFQFDMVEQAMKALPELLELHEARKDPNTRRYEANIRLNRVLRSFTGLVDVVHPETAEEEAAMIAAKKERRERIQREADMERERLRNAEPPPPMSRHYEDYLKSKAERELRDWKTCGEYEI